MRPRCATWAEASTSEPVRAQARQTPARAHVVRPTSTRTNATTAGKLETPCALRDRCKRWETGVDVRREREATNEQASAERFRTSSVGAARGSRKIPGGPNAQVHPTPCAISAIGVQSKRAGSTNDVGLRESRTAHHMTCRAETPNRAARNEMRKNLLDIKENDGEERLVTRALESRPRVLNDVSDCDGKPPTDFPPGIPKASGLARELTVRARATAGRGMKNVNGGARARKTVSLSPSSNFTPRAMVG